MSNWYFGNCERCDDKNARAVRLAGLSAALCIPCTRDFDLLALKTHEWSRLTVLQSALEAAIQREDEARATALTEEANPLRQAIAVFAGEFITNKITRPVPVEAAN
jgi:hypothetical protein